jgi:hypothetical protein
MPVDTATLEQQIADVAGDDAELAASLRERFTKNTAAAGRFANGFLGRADVTRRQQEIATERKGLDTRTKELENQLLAGEAEKDKIMRDLAAERITAAKAKSLLQTVKQAYSLTDADLPGIDDLKETVRTGHVVDSTPDVDARFKALKTELFNEINSKLIPELGSMAILPTIWADMAYEHERLFGKRLSKKDQGEILKEAREQNKSIESVWSDKYSVEDKRLDVRDADNKKKYRQEWEDEQSKLSQERALNGVRPEQDFSALDDRQSPIFKRTFAPAEEKAVEGGTPPKATSSDAGRERMGGAERAAAKFMERARTGQLGKPLEVPARKSA